MQWGCFYFNTLLVFTKFSLFEKILQHKTDDCQMKINHLKLKNYKCFEEFEISFSSEFNLHVLLAPNMVGKSAVLSALRVMLATRLYKIKTNEGTQENKTITQKDHRVIGTNPYADIAEYSSIEVQATSYEYSKDGWKDAEFSWKKYRGNFKVGNAKKENITSDIIKTSYNSYNRCIEKKEGILPLLLFVGTEYIHQSKPETTTLDLEGSAKQGYWYCLDNKSMEGYVFTWFEKLYRTTEEQKKSEIANDFYGELAHNVLTVFKIALTQMLPNIEDCDWVKNTIGKKNSKTDTYSLVFRIKNEGIRTYEMLSDGYRYLVLLIGEMVTRATLLNKHLGINVLEEIRGVVLIDEFGIHLHPDLQSDALMRLQAIFPKVQFIITTHSPMLVNGLKKEQIHILSEQEDGTRIAELAEEDAIGLGAEGILKEFFGLDTTFDTATLEYQEDYKKLFNKRIEGKLNADEKTRFTFLNKELSKFRFDNSLTAAEDPIVKLVKERLEKDFSLKNVSSAPTESLETRVNAILDEILKGPKL